MNKDALKWVIIGIAGFVIVGFIFGAGMFVGGLKARFSYILTKMFKKIFQHKFITIKDISLQFLAEAVMLTFLGGAIGILLGAGIAQGITFFTGMATKISLFSIILAFSVSAGIGIGFGYWSASKAAKLNPIEALRYE